MRLVGNADQVREFSPQTLADVLCVVGLEIAEAGGLKQDDNRHHFADVALLPEKAGWDFRDGQAGMTPRSPTTKYIAVNEAFAEQMLILSISKISERI